MNPNWSKKHEAPSNKIQVWGEHCLQPVWYLFGVQNEGFQKRSSSIPTSLGDNHFKRQKLKQLPLLWSPRLSVHVAKCLAVADYQKFNEMIRDPIVIIFINQATNQPMNESLGLLVWALVAQQHLQKTSHKSSWHSCAFVVIYSYCWDWWSSS